MEPKKIMKKVCLLGDGAVGKTSLIRKFVFDSFDDKYIMTFGTKVTKKELRLDVGGQDYELILMMWDILGQRVHDNLHSSYYQGAAGAFVVCDVTRRETFEGANEWLRVFRSVSPDTPIIFLGNKSDLADRRAVSDADLQKLSDGNCARYLLTSAKTGANVEEAFLSMSNAILEGMRRSQ
ncbi:MAG: GTP-binding protein [Euryarchaeota archaeon]|nr:GTP-binding protein [Euryarchaeota archaeon]